MPLDTYRNAEGPARQIIHAGTFWDGASPQVQHNVDIEVHGNRIKSVRPHRKPGKGENVVDASKLFVMPGLWDTHFHREREIRMFGDRTNRAQLAYGMTSTLAPGDVAYSTARRSAPACAPDRAASPPASRSTAHARTWTTSAGS